MRVKGTQMESKANEKAKDNEQKKKTKKNYIQIAEGKLRKQMNDSNANK